MSRQLELAKLPCPLGIEQVCETLINRLEQSGEIPKDYEPNGHYWQIIADIRHTFTNYEELLYELNELAPCLEYLGNGGICRHEETEEPCLPAEVAHDKLKTTAKFLAEKIYADWYKNNKTT